MSYIGSSAAVTPVAFSGVNAQSFNGNGSTVAFTLNRPVSSVKAIEVVVNNVQQSPYDGSYSVNDTTLTFSAAPSTGTGNIYVVYRDFPVGSITDPNTYTKTQTDTLLADRVAKTGDTMTGDLVVNTKVGIGVASPSTTIDALSIGAPTTLYSGVATVDIPNGGIVGYVVNNEEFWLKSTDGEKKTITWTGTLTYSGYSMFGPFNATVVPSSPIVLSNDGTGVYIATDSFAGMTNGSGTLGATSITITNTQETALQFSPSGLVTGNITSSMGLTVAGSATIGGNSTINGMTIGTSPLYRNTVIGTNVPYNGGQDNAFYGYEANKNNIGGGFNTSIGSKANYTSTYGGYNVAVGSLAMYNNTSSYNTSIGAEALRSNTTAYANTAVGYQAGYNTTTGNNNTFVGSSSGTAITVGSKNTILGRYSGNQNGLDIRTANNQVVISDGDGKPYYRVDGTASPTPLHYFLNMSGGAGTNTLKYHTSTGGFTYDTSSARYKENIRDSVYGLSHVMQMRSAQFEYKDGGRSDVGLIAEELDLIIPELVGKNKDGEPDSVSYDRMVSVLVKAIQELKAEFDAYKASHP